MRTTLKAASLTVLLTVTLTACNRTQVAGLDRVMKVDEFVANRDALNRALSECGSNPGQLKDDPNCINAAAAATQITTSNGKDEMRRLAARQDIGTVIQALKLYRLDNGAYPTQEQGLAALVQKPTGAPAPANWKEGGYLERMPPDPWGAPYQYRNPGTHGEIDVFSTGGGQGNGSDSFVGSWQ
ncbi:type II secretion system major pseudopilin GspG [Burkholderia pyrrocinia]|nr:type II secretion system major pseudopilin GspG [Burkholderia pyrrocinia]